MDKISSVEAKNYINSLPRMEKKKFNEVFSGANPVAIDLLEAMLEIDPDRRITAEQTLAHPYLAQVLILSYVNYVSFLEEFHYLEVENLNLWFDSIVESVV